MQDSEFTNQPSSAILSEIETAVACGGDSGRWLGRAYLSWYRGNDQLIDLSGFESLDARNRSLFMQMLVLRRRAGWSDKELWITERAITALLDPADDIAHPIGGRRRQP